MARWYLSLLLLACIVAVCVAYAVDALHLLALALLCVLAALCV